MKVPRSAVSVLSLLAGLLGTLACVGLMVLIAVGVIGVGASSVAASARMDQMAGMGGQASAATGSPNPIVAFLLTAGPVILLVSIAAITLSFALRRRAAAIPAIVGGGILYWGMYGQGSRLVMAIAIVLGLLIWGATELWLRSKLRRNSVAAERSNL